MAWQVGFSTLRYLKAVVLMSLGCSLPTKYGQVKRKLISRMRMPAEHLPIQKVPFVFRQQPHAGLRPDFDHTLADQDFYGFPERVAAHSETSREQWLGRQHSFRGIFAAHDAPADLLDDLVMQTTPR